VIRLERVAARQRPLALASVTVSWGAGVHSVLGTRSDGGPLLLSLVAGLVRPRSGIVRVLDADAGSPEVHRQVARVPVDVALPDALRVDESLALAATIRREPSRSAADRLAPLGIEALADRPVRALSRPEARAVALAEALSSTRVRVVLLEEPYALMDARACARLAGCVRARADAGCAVIVDTASTRDAADLADDHVLLRAGALVGRAGSMEELATSTVDGARIRIVARDEEDGRAIGSALAREAEVRSVERTGAAVVARGPNAASLAQAAERAIVAAAHDVTEIRIDPPSLDEARAAAARVTP
jgi:ABC-type multidrug transport system ATPase subunit